MASSGGLADVSQSQRIQKIRQIICDDTTGKGWDAIWRENLTPWDNGAMQAPLRDLIEGGKVPFATVGRAIVPGCGRGYEAVYIASTLRLETVAMDISPTGIEAANANLKASSVPEGTRLTFVCGDFFQYKISDDQKFDLGFDYTFFVAIPPTLRPVWGKQMRELIKTGGYLITLVWPIDGDRSGGPPYSVHEGLYTEALQAEQGHWTKVLSEETISENRKGKERIVVWQRK